MRFFRISLTRFSLVIVALVPVLLTAGSAASSPGAGPVPLAFYPLQSDDLDATGINGPVTRLNAPFQNGGAYCNGIYMTSEGSDIITPELPGLNFGSFAASIEFMMDDYPAPEVAYRPVLICGYAYRYLGAEILSNGHILFLYNNGNRRETSTTVSTGVWHHVLVTYGEPASTGRLYLDGVLLDSVVFDLVHGEDRDVSVVNRATGRTFQGTVRNLVVYQSAFDITPIEATTWGEIKSMY